MKNILIFSNGEKIGDGLIKLPFLYEIKRRFPNNKIYWMTNKNKTVFNDRLKNIANEYIDVIYEQANIQPFFWKKISNKYAFEKMFFNYILDTQKTVMRTIALKRIKSDIFISSSAAGIFSNKKISKEKKIKKYYLENLFELLDLIAPGKIDYDYKINIPDKLINKLDKIFDSQNKYIGYAPGAGEKNKIWNTNNFIEIAKLFENKNYKSVFFIGPDDQEMKFIIKKSFPNALYPEELIQDFSGPEIVIASTKYLSCSLSNDSGVSHMLSTNYCPLIKLFGPKDSIKFTPPFSNIKTISSTSYGSKHINDIPIEEVKNKLNEELFKK